MLVGLGVIPFVGIRCQRFCDRRARSFGETLAQHSHAMVVHGGRYLIPPPSATDIDTVLLQFETFEDWRRASRPMGELATDLTQRGWIAKGHAHNEKDEDTSGLPHVFFILRIEDAGGTKEVEGAIRGLGNVYKTVDIEMPDSWATQ